MNRLSIRWRIALWNTAAFAVILLGFGLAVYGLLRKTHYDQVDRRLQAQFCDLTNHSVGTGNPWGPLLAQKNGGYSAYVLDKDRQVVEQAGNLSREDMAVVDAPNGEAPRFDTDYLPGAGHVRRLIAWMPNVEPERTVVILADLEHVDEELWEVIRTLLITTPITLLAAASIAYFLAYKALSPVDGLRRMTNEITAERLDRRLPIRNPADELGLLAQTINSMIARLERSFSEIRRFTADASHELRTPVSVIRSEAELGLAAAHCSEPARKRFESIVEECGRLADLTTQLLALCREEAGLTQMRRAPVHLRSLISDSVAIMRPLAEAKQQELVVDIQDDAVILGDAERLRQVFCNLLENAIKYTPGGGRLSVTLVRHNSEAVLTIEDNGIGISSEDLPRVFDRFYQTTPGRSEGGAGLGLSIVKSIVTAHQGRIEVASKVGSGSVFNVFLPTVEHGPRTDSDGFSAARHGDELEKR